MFFSRSASVKQMTHQTCLQDDGLTEQVQCILKQAGQAGLMLKGNRTWIVTLHGRITYPTYPQEIPPRKAGKSSFSKVPAGMGYVYVPRKVFIFIFFRNGHPLWEIRTLKWYSTSNQRIQMVVAWPRCGSVEPNLDDFFCRTLGPCRNS